MSNQFFRKYIDIVNEAEQVDEILNFGKPKSGDINAVASKLKFKPTKKQAKEYRYIPDVMYDLPNMPPMSYGVNTHTKGWVKTYTSDGKESPGESERGDIIMSGPSGEQYIIDGDEFKRRYTGKIGGPVIPEQSIRMVALYRGKPMFFTSSFGQEMIIKPGDWLVKNGDQGYYRIAKKEFEQTYNVPK